MYVDYRIASITFTEMFNITSYNGDSVRGYQFKGRKKCILNKISQIFIFKNTSVNPTRINGPKSVQIDH